MNNRPHESNAGNLSSYLLIPEMIAPACFVLAIFYFVGSKREIDLSKHPHLVGTIGASLLTTSTTALFGRWREIRDLSRSDRQQDLQLLDKNMALCSREIAKGNYYTAGTLLGKIEQQFLSCYPAPHEGEMKEHYLTLCHKQAYLKFKQYDYTGAINILENIITKDPNHRDSLNLLGYIHFRLNDYTKSSKYIGNSLKIDRNQNSFYVLSLLLSDNTAEDATHHCNFEAMVGTNPLNPDSFLEGHETIDIYGRAFFKAKKYSTSLRLYIQAIAELPQNILNNLDKISYHLQIAKAGRALIEDAPHQTEITTLVDNHKVEVNINYVQGHLDLAEKLTVQYNSLFPDHDRIRIVNDEIYDFKQKSQVLNQPRSLAK